MSDDNAAGERLGHVLLAMVRFVYGAAIGVFLFAFIAVRIAHWADCWDFLSVSLFVAFVGGSGLLAVLFGNRFINWFLRVFFDH